MKAAGITTWFQFTQGSIYFAIREKKNGKIVSDYFAVSAIILPLIWLLLCLSLENRHYLTCECSCILCPNFENVCPNNGQFFSVGDATASPASPSHTLMLKAIKTLDQGRIKGGAMGAIAPGPPLEGGPPWWTLFVSNKILVWKIPWFRSDTRIQLYIIFLCCVNY